MVRWGVFEVTHIKRIGLKRGVKPKEIRPLIRISLASFKVREGLLYSRLGGREVSESS